MGNLEREWKTRGAIEHWENREYLLMRCESKHGSTCCEGPEEKRIVLIMISRAAEAKE